MPRVCNVLIAFAALAMLLTPSIVATEWVAFMNGEVTAQQIELSADVGYTYTVKRVQYSARYNQTLVQFDDGRTAALDSSSASVLQLQLGGSDSVINITHDQAIVRKGACTSALSWALDRIDQRARTQNYCYTVNYSGATVHAYIVDTGVEVTHSQFGGRATQDYTTLGSHTDCDGHGTHVAGLVGSSTYGSATGVRIHAIRVLDCGGSGTLGDLASGLMYVRENVQLPAVVNMSLGYGVYYGTIAALIQDLEDAGVVVVAAAGNANADGCTHYPSAHATVVSVGSIGKSDTRSSFSNYGTCVRVFAPGEAVRSTWIGGNTLQLSGTSMASPLVAGVVALLLHQNGARTPATVRSLLYSQATPNLVGNAQGSFNRIVYARLDADEAVSESASQTPTSVPTTPTPTPTRSRSRTPSSSAVAQAPTTNSGSGGGPDLSSAPPSLQATSVCALLALPLLLAVFAR